MKYLTNKNGELIFEQEKPNPDDLVINQGNRNFLLEANEDLKNVANSCRRELLTKVNINYNIERKISLAIFLAISLITFIISIVLAIAIHWVLLIINIMGLISAATGVIYYKYLGNRIKANDKALSEGKLYCGISLLRGEYAFIAGGKTIVHKYVCTLKELRSLGYKSYFIIAFNKETGKSVPIRLFA